MLAIGYDEIKVQVKGQDLWMWQEHQEEAQRKKIDHTVLLGEHIFLNNKQQRKWHRGIICKCLG